VSIRRAPIADALQPAAPIAQAATLGILFTIAGAAVAGVPPFAGFMGKVMILQSTAGLPSTPILWAAILGTSFLSLIALARAGLILFWKTVPELPVVRPPPAGVATLSPMMILLAFALGLVVFAEPIKRYADETATQLADRGLYRDAVLGATPPATRELLRASKP
jgi:multicomponent K+:H+ antiporter subunit D